MSTLDPIFIAQKKNPLSLIRCEGIIKERLKPDQTSHVDNICCVSDMVDSSNEKNSAADADPGQF